MVLKVKSILWFILFFTASFLTISSSVIPVNENPSIFPNARFVVISDLHVYDTSLGISGKAFEEYLASDRKLLKYTAEIARKAAQEIAQLPVDFVIVPGDLTKDGEKVSHHLTAEILNIIKQSGKKVYVMPGNHDINSGHAFRFIGDKTVGVDSVSPADFAKIYADYGYQNVLYRDPNSLTYIAEPLKGLWLLCIDACKYHKNKPGEEPETSGAIKPETLEWMRPFLKQATDNHITVLAAMHHGLIPHFSYQTKDFPMYLTDNYKTDAAFLAKNQVKVVFTGHHHAQDVVVKDYGKNNFLFDIQTGSTATYPCPYRVIELNEKGEMIIQSVYITSIPSMPEGFEKFAYDFVFQGISGIAKNILLGYKLSEKEAENLGNQFSKAFVAYYQGDEKFEGNKYLDTKNFSLRAKIVAAYKRKYMKSICHDLPPSDNNLIINLYNGNWTE